MTNTTQAPLPEIPLQDIHLPDAITLWPPAIGWWLLLLAFIALSLMAWRGYQRYRQKWGYRHIALRLLKQEWVKAQRIQQLIAQTSQSPQGEKTTNTVNVSAHGIDHQTIAIIVQEMLSIIKRTAITAYPSHDVASLYGDSWITFLNQHTHQDYFTQALAQLITDQQYQADTQRPINETLKLLHALHNAGAQWIKKHHSASLHNTRSIASSIKASATTQGEA